MRPLTVISVLSILVLLGMKFFQSSMFLVFDIGILHQDVVASTDLQAQEGSAMMSSTSIPVPINPNSTNIHNITHTYIFPTVKDHPTTQAHGEENHRPAGTSTSVNTKTKTASSSSCSSINTNSQTWLQGPRISNAPQQYAEGKEIDDDYLMDPNLLEHLPELTEQTICHADGRFRSTSSSAATNWNTSDAQLVQDWELKLIYASLHDMMHAPARNEYEARRSCPERPTNLPRQDYECPNTKYLVTAIPDQGLGASVRLGAMAHILMGIASDRIPLLLANTKPHGPDWLQTPWRLVSCARGDFQCVFMPTTPCTIWTGDLTNATVMEESEARPLRRSGVMDAKFQNDKVVIAKSAIAPAKMDKFQGIHKVIRIKFYRKAMELIERYQQNSSSNTSIIDSQKIQVLTKAAKRILEPDAADPHEHYTYGHRDYRIPHAIMMYFFRPNVAAKQRMKEQLKEIIPDWLDPQDTLGLPIRGSDKCNTESTCLDFDKYMQLATETWHDSQNTSALTTSTTTANKRGALVMTTEDPALFAQRLQYSKSSSNFPLEFVVNNLDPLQGTGNTKKYRQAADDILISSMLAIQMQFHARHVYGNCCSNFHLLLFDFLREGCGMTTQTTCLQETENYNVCCQWTKTTACYLILEDYKQQRTNQTKMENDRKQKMLVDAFLNWTKPVGRVP